MVQIKYSGKFQDIEALDAGRAAVAEGGTLEVELPRQRPMEASLLEQNAYECFIFALALMEKEALAERKFSIKVRYA